MGEIIFGTPEHIAGLSRKALEEDFRWVNDRRMELEGECERLNTENAKLREELAKARDPQRIGGQADTSSFVYAIEQLREFRWQHATNDEDAIPYINNVAAAHERENAKLREESSKYHDLYVHAITDAEVWHLQWSAEHQENAKLRELCADIYEMAYYEYPSAFETAFADRMRELGIEVD